MMPLDLAANDYLKRPGTVSPSAEPFKLTSPEKPVSTKSQEIQTMKEERPEHTESFFNKSQFTDFETREL